MLCSFFGEDLNFGKLSLIFASWYYLKFIIDRGFVELWANNPETWLILLPFSIFTLLLVSARIITVFIYQVFY